MRPLLPPAQSFVGGADPKDALGIEIKRANQITQQPFTLAHMLETSIIEPVQNRSRSVPTHIEPSMSARWRVMAFVWEKFVCASHLSSLQLPDFPVTCSHPQRTFTVFGQ